MRLDCSAAFIHSELDDYRLTPVQFRLFLPRRPARTMLFQVVNNLYLPCPQGHGTSGIEIPFASVGDGKFTLAKRLNTGLIHAQEWLHA